MRAVVSRFLVCIGQLLLTIPSLLLSVSGIFQHQNIIINIALFFFAFSNSLLFESLHFEPSFDREDESNFARCPRPFYWRFVELIIVSSLPLIVEL